MLVYWTLPMTPIYNILLKIIYASFESMLQKGIFPSLQAVECLETVCILCGLSTSLSTGVLSP